MRRLLKSAARRRVVIPMAVLVVAAVVAGVLVAVKGDWFRGAVPASDTSQISAIVGANGVDLSIGTITIHGAAGVAPPGTILTAALTTAAAPTDPSSLTTPPGGGVEVSLQGLQPSAPLELTFPEPGPPPPGESAVLISQWDDGSTHMIPATYRPDTHRIVATVSHLSVKWPAFLDFNALGRRMEKFLNQTVGIEIPRPDCAGRPATTSSGATVSLGGDFSASVRPVVWPCVTATGDGVAVKLASNSPLPWRVRAAPSASLDPQGSLDLSKAAILAGYQTLITRRPYAEGLLIPGNSMTYRFSARSLPGTIQGKIDVGTWLAMDLLYGFDEILALSGIKLIPTDPKLISCVGDVVDAAALGSKPSLDAISGLAKATLSCIEPLAVAAGGEPGTSASVLIGILSSGVGLVVAGLQGAVLTASSHDIFKIPVQIASPPRAVTDPTLGTVWAPSQQGYGEMRPTTISNGGDPSGLVTQVRWQSWGGPKAIGEGSGWFVPPGAITARGHSAAAEIIAFDLGMCQGKLMYRAISWFFPQYGEKFDPHTYINICTGDYVGTH